MGTNAIKKERKSLLVGPGYFPLRPRGRNPSRQCNICCWADFSAERCRFGLCGTKGALDGTMWRLSYPTNPAVRATTYPYSY
eukprot:scaffold353950_cov31-Prasinocladus_malaysianus.AAC.1